MVKMHLMLKSIYYLELESDLTREVFKTPAPFMLGFDKNHDSLKKKTNSDHNIK